MEFQLSSGTCWVALFAYQWSLGYHFFYFYTLQFSLISFRKRPELAPEFPDADFVFQGCAGPLSLAFCSFVSPVLLEFPHFLVPRPARFSCHAWPKPLRRGHSKPGQAPQPGWAGPQYVGSWNRLIVGRKQRARLNLICFAVMGHGLFGSHLSKWKYIDPVCTFCEEDKESSFHLWKKCPTLASTKPGLAAFRAVAETDIEILLYLATLTNLATLSFPIMLLVSNKLSSWRKCGKSGPIPSYLCSK